MVDFGQNVPGEKIAFILVWIAGQNKRLNAHIAVAVDFGKYLVWVADDGRATMPFYALFIKVF